MMQMYTIDTFILEKDEFWNKINSVHICGLLHTLIIVL